jgi:hypothetical protein
MEISVVFECRLCILQGTRCVSKLKVTFWTGNQTDTILWLDLKGLEKKMD